METQTARKTQQKFSNHFSRYSKYKRGGGPLSGVTLPFFLFFTNKYQLYIYNSQGLNDLNTICMEDGKYIDLLLVSPLEDNHAAFPLGVIAVKYI